MFLYYLTIGWFCLLFIVYAESVANGGQNLTRRYTYDYYDLKQTIPDCYIVESYAILDESVWYYALDINGYDSYAAEVYLTELYHSLYAEVNLRYHQFDEKPGACGCIRIYLAGIKIIKSRGESWSKSAEYHKHGKLYIDGPTALYECGKLAKQHRDDGVAHFDLAQCHTRKNIAWDEHDKGQKDPEFQELAFLSTVCNVYLEKYQVSIVEMNGASLSRQTAKAIALGIGAKEDSKAGCDDQAGYLLSTENSYAYNPYTTTNDWMFSHCSVRDICQLIEHFHENCLLHNSFTAADYYDKICLPLPGSILDLDEQCQLVYGAYSETCDNEYDQDICETGISCTKNGQCIGKVKVASGTPCGDNKVCFKGECTEIPTDDPGCPEKVSCQYNNGGCEGKCMEPNPGVVVCSCIEGFTLGPDLKSCLDNDECLTDRGGCEQICVNQIGSFTCECVPGYYKTGNTCHDINECLRPEDHLPPNCDVCVNTPGSFFCDENECDDANGGCDQICKNNPGSFECDCSYGYTKNGDFECEDINECEGAPLENCPNCVNIPGLFICFSCEEGWVTYGGSCYLFVDKASKQDEAEQSCNDLGATLVVINDKMEQEFVFNAAKDLYHFDSFWTALKQGGWTNGDSSTYRNFADGEGLHPPPNDCVIVDIDEDGEWYNRNCQNSFSRVCEKDGFSN